MENTVASHNDRFETIMAIFIGLVTLVGALVAWRSSVAGLLAGDAHFATAQAEHNAEYTRTNNDIILFRHYRAYTDFTEQQLLAQQAILLDDIPSQLTAQNLATTNQLFFPRRYLNRDGSYDVTRQLGESWAQAEQVLDLDPSGHIAEAAIHATKVKQLFRIFVVLSVTLIFYTLAEGVHPQRQKLRYSLAAIGTALLFLTTIAIIYVERV